MKWERSQFSSTTAYRADFELTGEFNGHSNGITAIANCQENQNGLITACVEGSAVIWSLNQTQKSYKDEGNSMHTVIDAKIIKTIYCHKEPIRSVAIEKNGQFAVTASTDTSIKIWNLHTFTLQLLCNGHHHEVSSVEVASDGSIISGSRDTRCMIWNKMGNITHTLSHSTVINSVMLSPDNQYLVTASIGLIRIYKMVDIRNSDSAHCAFKIHGHRGAKFKLAISHDSKYLASG